MRQLFVGIMLVLLVLGFSAASVSASSNICTATAPAGVEKFPRFKKGPSTTEQADLGLHPRRLTAPLLVLNEHREDNPACGGTWKLEMLPIGDIILDDKDGNPVYRANCGNRIVRMPIIAPPPPPLPCPCSGTTTTTTQTTPSTTQQTDAPSTQPWWARGRWNPLSNLWREWNTPANWWWWASTVVEVLPKGGCVDVTSGDTHVLATGQAAVYIYRH